MTNCATRGTPSWGFFWNCILWILPSRPLYVTEFVHSMLHIPLHAPLPVRYFSRWSHEQSSYFSCFVTRNADDLHKGDRHLEVYKACHSVTSCSRSYYYTSYGSYGNPLSYEVWWHDLLQELTVWQTKILRYVGWSWSNSGKNSKQNNSTGVMWISVCHLAVSLR